MKEQPVFDGTNHEECFGKGELQNRKLFKDAMKAEELVHAMFNLMEGNIAENPDDGKHPWEFSDQRIVDEAIHVLEFWLEPHSYEQTDSVDRRRIIRQLKRFLEKHGDND